MGEIPDHDCKKGLEHGCPVCDGEETNMGETKMAQVEKDKLDETEENDHEEAQLEEITRRIKEGYTSGHLSEEYGERVYWELTINRWGNKR